MKLEGLVLIRKSQSLILIEIIEAWEKCPSSHRYVNFSNKKNINNLPYTCFPMINATIHQHAVSTRYPKYYLVSCFLQDQVARCYSPRSPSNLIRMGVRSSELRPQIKSPLHGWHDVEASLWYASRGKAQWFSPIYCLVLDHVPKTTGPRPNA